VGYGILVLHERNEETVMSESTATRTSLTAGGGIDAFRREMADKAIARIEECYRRGLAIPQV